ncbi:prolyl-tRNA synthetase associated domain-containing protein [Peptostreptococcus faecalis]|uniref:prolyl-tRNA synthetase associated domain-containing protein n=1 Tax=Peptostreptococcus faecalis TaxID=2045015 RepID=UPI000C7AEDFF|nr:prolyl-tRNA synthetase associated domain-containing protein [Peptostreptococcus faecalis]
MYISEIEQSRPTDAPENVNHVFDLLEKFGISYDVVTNDPVEAMTECVEIGEKLGSEIRKSVFLTNRKKTEFYLLVMPAEKKFDTKVFCDALGVSRVSFASGDLMKEKIGVEPGTASVMSLTLDKEKQVQLVLDKEILDDEYFSCNPTDNRYHLKINTKDLLEKFIPGIGYRASVISLG